MEDSKMSNLSTYPRILFVTPDVAFMPEWEGSQTNFIPANAGRFGDFQAELISNLFELGADVHVAQPDFHQIFSINSRKEKSGVGVRLPCDRVHLAEDRSIFYSRSIGSNSEWENIKISLAFQREVVNQIIPRVGPDLIHCCDWMTGLIPAVAKKIKIPCLFTVQRLDTATSLLSCVEDIGIDAAGFWQNLFYDRYPGNYEETRDTNPLDLLLSGILAADHVDAARTLGLRSIAEGRSDYKYSPLGKLLAQKWKAGCVSEIPDPLHLCLNPTRDRKVYGDNRTRENHAGSSKITDLVKRQSISSFDNRTPVKCYIDLYETILQRPLVALEKEQVPPTNKNNRAKASGVEAASHRKERSKKSYALAMERISTITVAPI
jgi:starch synthase/alpha-amylase